MSFTNTEGAPLRCHQHALIPFWTDYLQSSWFLCLFTASHPHCCCQIPRHWCSFLQIGSGLMQGPRQTNKSELCSAWHIWHMQAQPALSWPLLRKAGVGKSHQRLRKMGKTCTIFAAFVCETSSFNFIWSSLLPKAPGALLSSCTEQQGVMHAQKTGAVRSINTEVTHFKSGRRQAGKILYQIRAMCIFKAFVSDSGWCQMFYGGKLKLRRLTKQALCNGGSWQLKTGRTPARYS